MVTVVAFPAPGLPICGPRDVDVSGIITSRLRNSCEKVAAV